MPGKPLNGRQISLKDDVSTVDAFSSENNTLLIAVSTLANEKDSVGGGPEEKPLAVLLKKDPLGMAGDLELDCKGPDIIPAGTLSKKGLSGNNCCT